MRHLVEAHRCSERRNQRWSMDFASDALWTGRRFRRLCLVDDATRESPALLTDVSIAGARVVRLLDELADRHGLPEAIVVDNGPEFTGRALFAWSARTGVRLRFIQPGRPIQNAQRAPQPRCASRASSAGSGTSA